MSPRILITGKKGQVGRSLLPATAALGEVIAVDRQECDLSDATSVSQVVRAARPDIIINAAAYTAVDKAESEPDLAYAVNATAPGVMAEAADKTGAVLIHYSTDYVFDGRKTTPYVEEDETNPLSVYGAGKRDGEVAVRRHKKHFILRTSWVFSSRGTNFLNTILKAAQNRPELRVVCDQLGAPTSAVLLAEMTARLIQRIGRDGADAPFGTYHLCASGAASWYDYAVFLIEQARRMGMPLQVTPEAVKPIPAAEYPLPAARPQNSRLDTGKFRSQFGMDLPPWQNGVLAALESYSQS